MTMQIDPTAYVHPRATVIGNVTLGARASVWPGAVLRADNAPIAVGADSNVQDGVIVHVDEGVPVSVGARVTIGHGAIVHGATVEDDCLIGMGAILLNGVHVGTGSVVAAGAVCTEGFAIPPDSVVAGVPARVVKQTDAAIRARIRLGAEHYVAAVEDYRAGKHEEFDGPEPAANA
ncbi:MAG TPA: gamma carbonic anhydrase family protein [Gemmatimonadaceae bacterium]|nr:gamma carbonic anhydrase family protein [Gemmatimonadaceae bacterium]